MLEFEHMMRIFLLMLSLCYILLNYEFGFREERSHCIYLFVYLNPKAAPYQSLLYPVFLKWILAFEEIQ